MNVVQWWMFGGLVVGFVATLVLYLIGARRDWWRDEP